MNRHSHILDAVLAQVAKAGPELKAYGPRDIDWLERARDSVGQIVPWLVNNADRLKTHVETVGNSSRRVRSNWEKLKKRIEVPASLRASMDEALQHEELLLQAVTGDILSSIVAKFLVREFPGDALQENGKSDYPDLYLGNKNYDALPVHKRSQQRANNEHRASLKGTKRRPVRVPDGMEIKTCNNTHRVDCHYPHVGLHLAVLCETDAQNLVVVDVRVAYLCRISYKQSTRATEATTVKYSFSVDAWKSLLL